MQTQSKQAQCTQCHKRTPAKGYSMCPICTARILNDFLACSRMTPESRAQSFATLCEYARVNNIRRIAIKNKWIKRGISK